MLQNPKAKKAIVGILIVVIGYMFVLPRFQATEALPTEIPEGAGPGPTYPIEASVYNLATVPQQQQRYLKLAVTLEFEAEDVSFFELEGHTLEAEIEHFRSVVGAKHPIIADAVGRLVQGKTLEEISTVVGREALREELLEEVGGLIHEPHLINVYFTEFVFQ